MFLPRGVIIFKTQAQFVLLYILYRPTDPAPCCPVNQYPRLPSDLSPTNLVPCDTDDLEVEGCAVRLPEPEGSLKASNVNTNVVTQEEKINFRLTGYYQKAHINASSLLTQKYEVLLPLLSWLEQSSMSVDTPLLF